MSMLSCFTVDCEIIKTSTNATIKKTYLTPKNYKL